MCLHSHHKALCYFKNLLVEIKQISRKLHKWDFYSSGFIFICVFFFWFVFPLFIDYTNPSFPFKTLWNTDWVSTKCSSPELRCPRLASQITITALRLWANWLTVWTVLSPSHGSIPGKQTLEFTKAHSCIYYCYSFRLFTWDEGCLGSNRTRPSLAPAGCPWPGSLWASHAASASWRDPNAFAGGEAWLKWCI